MMKILQQQKQIFVGAFADKNDKPFYVSKNTNNESVNWFSIIPKKKKKTDPNWPVWSQKLPI